MILVVIHCCCCCAVMTVSRLGSKSNRKVVAEGEASPKTCRIPSELPKTKRERVSRVVDGAKAGRARIG